jgi:ATP-dependent exoDNAse (exonuclease V) alpha subunit
VLPQHFADVAAARAKSFTVRSVVELAKARRAEVVLAAPTGRAAKRLAELTGRHRPPAA